MARLTADDWTAAALETLLTDGPDAVAIQPLARHLEATKGSFYWHFETRDDLLRAALDSWLAQTTTDVVAATDAASADPAERARLFVRTLAEQAVDQPGQLRLLAVADHADVAAALETATQQRVDYLAKQLRALGVARAAAGRRATLAYAALLGYAQLAATTTGVLPAGPRPRRALLDELSETLLTG